MQEVFYSFLHFYNFFPNKNSTMILFQTIMLFSRSCLLFFHDPDSYRPFHSPYPNASRMRATAFFSILDT